MGRNNYGKAGGFGVVAAALAVSGLSLISSFVSELADLQRTNYSSIKASLSQMWIILVLGSDPQANKGVEFQGAAST